MYVSRLPSTVHTFRTMALAGQPPRDQLYALLVERINQPWRPVVGASTIAHGGLGLFIEGTCSRGTVVAVYAGDGLCPRKAL